jgi:hypothetical protein
MVFLAFYALALAWTIYFQEPKALALGLIVLLLQIVLSTHIEDYIDDLFPDESSPETEFRSYAQTYLLTRNTAPVATDEMTEVVNAEAVLRPTLEWSPVTHIHPTATSDVWNGWKMQQNGSAAKWSIQSKDTHDYSTEHITDFFPKGAQSTTGGAPTHLFILGDTGSGKTNQLGQLADYFLQHDSARLPVYVQLTSWAANCLQFGEWLVSEIEQQYAMKRSRAQRLVDQNHLVLLLDDFERVPEQHQRQFVRTLVSFFQSRLNRESAHEVHDSLVLAATVPTDLVWDDSIFAELSQKLAALKPRVLKAGQSFEPFISRVTIRPLNSERIQRYLDDKQWTGADVATQYESIAKAISNPLYLQSLPAAYANVQEWVAQAADAPADAQTELLRRQITERALPNRLDTNSVAHNESKGASIDPISLLGWLARRLGGTQSTVDVTGRMRPYYLAEVVVNKQNYPREWSHFTSLVTLLTSLSLPLIYAITYMVFHFTTYPGTQLNLSGMLLGCIALLIFGGIYGHLSTAHDHASSRQNTRTRWYLRLGLISSIFLSPLLGYVFFSISVAMFGGFNGGEGLVYESMVYAIYCFPLFTLIGGLELGRRYDVAAQPKSERRFVGLVMLMSIFFWTAFFFAFILWPRTPSQLMAETLGISSAVGDGLNYAIIWGMCWGLMSGFIMSHEFFRHRLMSLFVQFRFADIATSLSTQLHDLTQRGILVQRGGGYAFRNEAFRRHFAEVPAEEAL